MTKLTLLSAAAIVLFATTTHAAATISQGKKNSTLTDNVGAVIPSGAGVTYSVPMPTKYKSKKGFALVTVSVQCQCAGDIVSIEANIGAVPMIPSGGGYNFCQSDGVYAFRTAQFTLPPESLGGPAVVPDTTVDVKLTSISNAASTGTGGVTIRVDLGQ